MADLAGSIRGGDLRAIARAATLIENRSPDADALMADLFPHTGRAADRRHHRSAGLG